MDLMFLKNPLCIRITGIHQCDARILQASRSTLQHLWITVETHQSPLRSQLLQNLHTVPGGTDGSVKHRERWAQPKPVQHLPWHHRNVHRGIGGIHAEERKGGEAEGQKARVWT